MITFVVEAKFIDYEPQLFIRHFRERGYPAGHSLDGKQGEA